MDQIVVLIVEDEAEIRALARRVLTRSGFCVLTAADADAALQIMTAVVPDLLFTDIVLPGGIDGLQLAALAKSLDPEIKIAATTGYAISSERLAAVAGILLPKPYAPNDLIEHIDKVLAA
ncbi:MAG: response regulator [Alphaproteobacteria bacterium]|nr:response regulator [Alphaproteobacteria bacterium]